MPFYCLRELILAKTELKRTLYLFTLQLKSSVLGNGKLSFRKAEIPLPIRVYTLAVEGLDMCTWLSVTCFSGGLCLMAGRFPHTWLL